MSKTELTAHRARLRQRKQKIVTMKTIFTLIILAFSVCSFGQKLTSADVDKAANEAARKTDHQAFPKVEGVSTTKPSESNVDKANREHRSMTLQEIKDEFKDKPVTEGLTAADSIVLPIAKFEPSVKVDLDNFDAEITKLAKQYEDIIKVRTQTLKTAYGIYCGQHKIDPSRATVKLDKDGFIIQVLK